MQTEETKSKKRKKVTMSKAIIMHIIIAFIYSAVLVAIVAMVFGTKIKDAISIVNIITIQSEEVAVADVKMDLEHNKLEKKPRIGTKYGSVVIEDLDVNLPLYYGDSLSILRYGIGHTFGSYFPGEGGSIIMMGHNTSGYLKRLPEIQIGTKIKVNTVYGEYTYTVYETRIVDQSDVEACYVQGDKEILMLYTCYPVNSFGHARQRFITYSSLD